MIPRLPILVLLLCLCPGATEARTTPVRNPDDAPVKVAPVKPPAPRRVLFRTDSPRLFPPKAVKITVTPPKREPAVTKPVVRIPPPARSRIVSVPALPKPPLPAPVAPRLTLPEPVSPLASRREIDFLPTSYTPYDRYMGTVRAVISRLDARAASMGDACELVAQGRHFRYLMSDPYRAQPPAVTEARRAGDCKSKALWLYDHLGDPSAYYVIGKLERRSRSSHAWVYWRNQGRWWILDPTDRSSPVAADSVPSGRYVPYYSYSRAGIFRHNATRILMAANGSIPVVSPAVAGRSRTK